MSKYLKPELLLKSLEIATRFSPEKQCTFLSSRFQSKTLYLSRRTLFEIFFFYSCLHNPEGPVMRKSAIFSLKTLIIEGFFFSSNTQSICSVKVSTGSYPIVPIICFEILLILFLVSETRCPKFAKRFNDFDAYRFLNAFFESNGFDFIHGGFCQTP